MFQIYSIQISNSMDLYSLNVFVEVVRQGGFTAACPHVHLTQPSISRVIRQLEHDLGHTLLTRDQREVVLTDAGKIVFNHANILLGQSSRLRSELADMSGLRSGELSLGIPPLGGALFVPLIKKFKTKHPNIHLRLVEKGSKETENALISSELEIGTLLLPLNSQHFDQVLFSRDHLMLAVASSSPWAKRKSVRLSDLKDEPFILFPEGFALNDRILAACRAASFEPKIVSRSSHSQLITGLIDSGVGVALLPRSVAKAFTNVKLVKLAGPALEWNIALAWLKDSYLSHAAKEMIALAKANPLAK